jgi:hypothetical protein
MVSFMEWSLEGTRCTRCTRRASISTYERRAGGSEVRLHAAARSRSGRSLNGGSTISLNGDTHIHLSQPLCVW